MRNTDMSFSFRPLVTIAIPTYNRAGGYLGLALQSASGQTYPDIEILVADNASTDGTGDLVRSYADPRIRYIRHAANIGANNNFNFCVREARGKYFLLLHDDDLIDPDFVEVCMDAVGTGDAGLVRTGTRIIDSVGNVVREAPNRAGGLSGAADFFLGWFEGKTELYLCSTLFHTDRLREIGGFNSKTHLFQDVVAEVQLAARWGRAEVFDIKASFRRHEANNGRAARIGDWVEDSLYLLDHMTSLSPRRGPLVRQRGVEYFAYQNYNRLAKHDAANIRAYFMIYRLFEYRVSPVRFLYNRRIRYWLHGARLKLAPPSSTRRKTA
jgi:glycosyltransferase involved in cell wall biosynthesis